jgi:hypothetical protein
MVKIESKEKLAKLLAVEDLDIQHQQVKTAMFDVKNRQLILPIWKDMPDHLYDLLVGHEVGHALFTPLSLKRIEKIIKKTSKDCVNIIEDARIEKLVKRRYPGLKKPFHKGYNNLINRNFFGLEDRNINESGFLDRINIRFKMPQHGEILFNDEEMMMVKRIENAKTFIDVEEIAVDVHAYVKENEQPNPQDKQNMKESDSPDFSNEGFMPDSQDQDSDGGDEQEDSSPKGDQDSGETPDGNEKGEDESNEGGDTDKDGDNFDGDIDGEGEKPESKEPLGDEVKSTTQRQFDENMEKMHVDTSKHNLYLNVPEHINKEAIVDYKIVHNNINKYYSECSDETSRYYGDQETFKKVCKVVRDDANKTLRKLKKDSLKTVNHIAMEFERKKCADIYKRTSVTKSGVLDTNKLFSAKYNEDVFRKNIRVPEGKNHGLVMFIDWSGSMSYSISDCIKQVIELAFFCKKVNIPFDVYSFTDAMYHKGVTYSFKHRHNDFACDPKVRLRNYLSSRMSTKEFNNALSNLCIFINKFQGGYRSWGTPKEDDLCSTPLNGAIILSEHVIRDFKRKNNLESVHAVWLTDGDANSSTKRWDAEKNCASSYFSHGDKNWPTVYLTDKKRKKNYCLYGNGAKTTTISLFNIVKDRLGINIVGFFVVPSFTLNNLYRFLPRGDMQQTWEQREIEKKTWVKAVKKANYFIKEEAGYDEYYVISSQLQDKKPPQEILDTMTASKMVNIFSKRNSQFKAKRVILSKFVDLITAK